MFHGFETFRVVLSKLIFAAFVTIAVTVVHSETAYAQCSIILCATHEIDLPVAITNSSSSPGLTVMGGNIGFGTLSPSAGLDVALTGSSSAIRVPRDTTANRPIAAAGMIRYNTDDDKFEFYEGAAWKNLGTTSGGGGGSSQWADVTAGISYATGSVGIGTSSPSTLLHISGAGDVVSTVQTSSTWASAALRLVGGSTNADWHILTNRADLNGTSDSLGL